MAGLTNEQFDAIAALANQGLAGRELREAVYDLLKIKLGRNQIGGILYRLRASKKVTVRPDKNRGIARRPRAELNPSKSVPRPVHAHAPGLRARFAPPSGSHGREAAPSTSPRDIPPIDVVIERGPATIFDLQADSCRWPLWRADHQPITEKLFCNEVRCGDGPYCGGHTRASHNRHDHPVSIRNAAYVKKTYFD